MSNIKSFKITAKKMTLRNMIELYHSCQNVSHQIYIYSKKSMGKIKDIIDFETYRMINPDSEYVIVIEGKEAKHIVNRFEKLWSNNALLKG
ncbi:MULTISPECIES: hypothetical protein [Bacillus]|uniref:General stress protein n=2 Tax=Bacillus TaxID=1386 RepID=A0A0M4GAY3_9BACI|nr:MULTISPECIES: hypothetical protein [Bacillus]ALC82765.1 hypothetical protein AM592_15110 [Bacillus gobiensis]MBP1081719.1 hypothetical protein [Bacillus capparidis]MED1096372.1 hypothetical protein [Bacillus capparidis]